MYESILRTLNICFVLALVSAFVCFGVALKTFHNKSKKLGLLFTGGTLVSLVLVIILSGFLDAVLAKDSFSRIFEDPVDSVSHLQSIQMKGERKAFSFETSKLLHIKDHDKFCSVLPTKSAERSVANWFIERYPWITNCNYGLRNFVYAPYQQHNLDSVDCDVIVLSDKEEKRYVVFYHPVDVR